MEFQQELVYGQVTRTATKKETEQYPTERYQASTTQARTNKRATSRYMNRDQDKVDRFFSVFLAAGRTKPLTTSRWAIACNWILPALAMAFAWALKVIGRT